MGGGGEEGEGVGGGGCEERRRISKVMWRLEAQSTRARKFTESSTAR